MILEHFTNDFKSLIKRFEVLKKFDRADNKLVKILFFTCF